jgi:chorismate mutase/prephenate dehydratase
MAVDLAESRKRLDDIDRQIAALFEERMQVTEDVAAYKRETGKPVLDRKREEEKLAAVAELVKGDFNKKGIRELYTQIMAIGRKYQYTMLAAGDRQQGQDVGGFPAKKLCGTLPSNAETKAAFFGVRGTYTEQAMEEFLGAQVTGIPCSTFREVMQAVKEKRADYGVLPIENSSTGSISDIYDLLIEYDNYIVGEHVVKIDHVLLGVPGAALSDVMDVYSHSQPLLQCRPYLNTHPEWKLHEEGSTAGCARKVKEEGKPCQAAIASKRAGQYYGLTVLAEEISMSEENSTRFIIICGEPWYTKEAGKISICFEVPHISGSLYHILSHFIFNGLNMTHIESRPIAGRNWEYRFFLDFTGNLEEAAVQNALAGIREEANTLMVLGNYQESPL